MSQHDINAMQKQIDTFLEIVSQLDDRLSELEGPNPTDEGFEQMGCGDFD